MNFNRDNNLACSWPRRPGTPALTRERRDCGGFIIATLILILLTDTSVASGIRGHLKPQFSLLDIPSDSQLQTVGEDPLKDIGIDLRLNFAGGPDRWQWQADYQLLSRQGDQLQLSRQNDLSALVTGGAIEDEQRIFDLTHRITDESDRVTTHRLDRLYLTRSSDSTVFKIGRQAVSWGNGLIYNPVDFFNPFDPTAIDTEYKTGDDMIYAQYLLDSGHDLQAVLVGRRDAGGRSSSEVSSLALKYHHFSGNGEFDLLLARHYEAAIVAFGASVDIGESIWRSDLMFNDDDSSTSLVLNWSQSWVTWQKNLNLVVEYFHNGAGIDDGDYSPGAFAANPELTRRLARGELFTPGQNYLATSVNIELTPLWILTTSAYRNLDDQSMLWQFFSQHDLAQDLQLLIAVNLPRGSNGSEFGGIDSGVEGQPFSVGASAFGQLAWYF